MTPDRSVIVTGGNSGLGLEFARSTLMAGGWTVVIAGRSPERIESARTRLIAETANPNAESMELDLGSLASIRRFAREFGERGLPPLHALVCNAGVQFASKTSWTKDGFEAAFGINHLGHFLLTNLLLRRLEAPSRVVFVSSGTHDPKKKTGMPAPAFTDARSLAHPADGLESETGATQRLRYTTSKLGNVYCAYELDRRLRATGLSTPDRPIDVVAFDPGLMLGTGLARDQGPALRFAWHRLGSLLRPLLRLAVGNVRTVEESGHALARLVTDPALRGQSGKYYEGLREIRSSAESYDQARAARLWDDSAGLVGLAPSESPWPAGDGIPA